MGMYYHEDFYYGAIVDGETIKNINVSPEGDAFIKKYVIKYGNRYLIAVKWKENGNYKENITKQVSVEDISLEIIKILMENKDNINIDELFTKIKKHKHDEMERIENERPEIIKFLTDYCCRAETFNDDEIALVLNEEELIKLKEEYKPLAEFYKGEPKWIIIRSCSDTYGW